MWLVRQPREAVGEPDLLEIPAGRLDVDGEAPLEAAQRELAEEISRGAQQLGADPHLLHRARASPTSACTCSAPRDLHPAQAHSGENERIEIVPWPLGELQRAIAECRDAKTLIGLLWLARRLNA